MLAARCTQNVQGRRFQHPRFGAKFAQALIDLKTGMAQFMPPGLFFSHEWLVENTHENLEQNVVALNCDERYNCLGKCIEAENVYWQKRCRREMVIDRMSIEEMLVYI